jgi:hypothetical protein
MRTGHTASRGSRSNQELSSLHRISPPSLGRNTFFIVVSRNRETSIIFRMPGGVAKKHAGRPQSAMNLSAAGYTGNAPHFQLPLQDGASRNP